MRDLIYFTQVEILKQIDLRRITRLLQDFEPDLKDTSIRPPRDENDESYFGSFAAILAQPDSLPERFHRALLSIEKAARPEHRDLVDATLQRRFPCVSLNGLCALGRAMELCISCPDELLNFPVPISAPSATNSQPST